ncbi:MAG: lipopolysaccharide biosynthesis protein [Acidimicrobiales bacterium]
MVRATETGDPRTPGRWPPSRRGSAGPHSSLLTSAATRFRKEAALSSVIGVVVFSLSLLTAPILARALGPEGRGDLAAVLMPAIVLSWLLSLGVPSAAAYFVDEVPERQLLSTVALLGLALGGPVCAGLWFLLPAFLDGHSQTTLVWARVALVAAPFSMGLQSAMEILRRRGAGASWNRWRSAPLILPSVGVAVLAVIDRLTLQTALAAYSVGNTVPLLLLVARLVRGEGGGPSMATLRLILPYASRSAVVVGTTALTVRLDQVVLATMVPSGQLGIYAVAVTASAASGPLTSGLSLALFGHQRSEGSPSRASTRYRRTIVLTLLLSSATAFAVALVAPVVLPLVFGQEFSGAVRALWILLPGQVAIDILVVFTTSLYAEGRPDEAMRAALLGGVITAVGLFTLVPRFGIVGAAMTTSLAFISEAIFLVARGVLRPSSPAEGEPDPQAAIDPTTSAVRELAVVQSQEEPLAGRACDPLPGQERR